MAVVWASAKLKVLVDLGIDTLDELVSLFDDKCNERIDSVSDGLDSSASDALL